MGEMENTDMASDGGVVLLKVKSRRFEIMRVEPSGYRASETWNDAFFGERKTKKLRMQENRLVAIANATWGGKDSKTYADSYLGSYTGRLPSRGRRNRLTRRERAVHTNLGESYPTNIIRICNSIRSDGTGDLRDEIEDVVACNRIKRECSMAWSRAGFGFQRRLGGEEVGSLVDGVYADEIGSKVWDQDVLLGGVEDGFVWVRGVLAAGDCARAGKGVGECLGGGDVAGGGYVVGLERAAGAVVGEEESVACRTDVY
jgi:hypothetical protein